MGLGFFENKQEYNRNLAKTKAKFIDVGAGGDCGFRSIAAGIIDRFLTHEKMDPQLLNKLLKAHFKNFPDQAHDSSNAVNRMQELIRTMHMDELVYTLAITLRQMAVEEMCKHPQKYPGAFVSQNENTSPEKMLQPGTWIDESAIAAIANVLNLAIEVKVIEDRKPLPARFIYTSGRENNKEPNIVIRLENSHYMPLLVNPSKFQNVSSHAITNIKVAEDIDFPDMQTITRIIDQQIKKDQEIYNNNSKRLITMLNLGEINKDWLLNCYITNTSRGPYLNGHAYHSGNVELYNTLAAGNFSQKEISNSVTSELVHALSLAISIGEISEENVFGEAPAKTTGMLPRA